MVVSQLHSTRHLQTMSLCLFAKLILPDRPANHVSLSFCETFVLNPLRTNLYRKSLSLRKTKTDRVDARTIASMLLSDAGLKPYTKLPSLTLPRSWFVWYLPWKNPGSHIAQLLKCSYLNSQQGSDKASALLYLFWASFFTTTIHFWVWLLMLQC